MTDTQTKPTELDRHELEDLGIDPPREDFYEAYQIDEDTIRVVVDDPDGGLSNDPPNEDHSGEDAWEWIEFRNGQERDEWRLENSVCSDCAKPIYWSYEVDGWRHDQPARTGGRFSAHEIKPAMPPNTFLIERYEHGQVRYAPIGESSQVDRQWDVAYGVAVIRFTKPDGLGRDDDPDRLLNFARGICDEYTSWCNGDIYGIVTYERVDAPNPLPNVIVKAWYETESCWGYLGYDWAVQAAKGGY